MGLYRPWRRRQLSTNSGSQPGARLLIRRSFTTSSAQAHQHGARENSTHRVDRSNRTPRAACLLSVNPETVPRWSRENLTTPMYSPTNASFDTGESVDVCKTRLDSHIATVGSVDGARDEAHDAMRSQATT